MVHRLFLSAYRWQHPLGAPGTATSGIPDRLNILISPSPACAFGQPPLTDCISASLWPLCPGLSLAVFLICWSLAEAERTGCRTAFGGYKPEESDVNLAAGDASRNLSTGQPFISNNPPHKGASPIVRGVGKLLRHV